MTAEKPLRMRDVCARTGLTRSTIHHYIREGVLPQPTKTGRNTATYDEEFVRRVHLVKALQERAHLPLAAIRETLERMPGDTVATVDVDRLAAVTRTIADNLRFASGRSLTKAELLAETGISAGELAGLTAVGLIEPDGRGAKQTYSPLDVRVALAYVGIRDAGARVAREAVGGEQIVRAYQKHLTALARVEAREMVRMLRTLAEIDLEAFISHTAEPLGDLVAALHQKALVKAITDLIGTTDLSSNGASDEEE